MDVSGIISTAGTQLTALQHAQRDGELAHFQGIMESILNERDNPDGPDRAQIRQAAEMFEAYFLQMMFREMRRTNFNENGIIPRSNAEQIFTDMMDETISDQAAAQGGFGLADMIYKQMTRRLYEN
ncbi:MAG: rod-binding protein [Defluviitaleaceae bacterium]|nr:rod-binding protein [Defluviitaleaceae bacterium]